MLAVLILVFALVGSNVAANHDPRPHDVPIGIVGPRAVVGAVGTALGHAAPGAYQIHGYPSMAPAQAAIRNRQVYGAYRPSSPALLVVASAASTAVSTLLEQTFASVAHAQHQTLVVRDLVPLPSSDPRGATAFSAIISLLVAGLLGSTAIFLLGAHLPPALRIAAKVALAVAAGLVAALLTNVIIGAFPGQFLGFWGVATLYVLAIALPIAAFQSLVGVAGTAIGFVMFLVIGNPASGGGSAPELLPGFWRALSQFLPPGAATTAVRDVVYFNGHGITHAAVVLGLWAFVGATVAFTVNTRRARSGKPTAAPSRGGEPATATSPAQP